MSFQVEPYQIAIIAIIVIAVAAWFFYRRNKRADSAGEQMVGQLRQGVHDLLSEQPSKEPALSPAAEDKDKAPAAPAPSSFATPSANPEEPAAAQPSTPGVINSVIPREPPTEEIPDEGHRMPYVDSLIEGVAHLTPHAGSFDNAKLRDVARTMQEAKTELPMHAQYYNEKDHRWYAQPVEGMQCTQIYFAMLLANRSKKTDELSAASFMTLCEQAAITLNADVSAPESSAMVENAARVEKAIESFSNVLTVRLICEAPIADEALAGAAEAAGFTQNQDYWVKRDAPDLDPVLTLCRVPEITNQLEISLDVPLSSPAEQPLSRFFAECNDLCCRLNAYMTDGKGQPIGSAAAGIIAQQIQVIYRSMARRGMAAGSPRALKIFSHC